MSDLPEIDTAIEGIDNMTRQLEWLHEVRAKYVSVYGRKPSRRTFAELDKALGRLRKAAR